MNKITLENFRCFRGKQEARLAPLTLLVGENSTGKTSFLALVRALWDVAFREVVPNFKEDPYDLGSYDEIAHFRGGKGGRADKFKAGFSVASPQRRDTKEDFHFQSVFQQIKTAPFPVQRRLARGTIWLGEKVVDPGSGVWFGVHNGQKKKSTSHIRFFEDDFTPLRTLAMGLRMMSSMSTEEYKTTFRPFVNDFMAVTNCSIYASAPVRSKPRRTYDPARPTPDPEGENIPMYLAETHFEGGHEWHELQGALERFGKLSGLFDQFQVKRLGKSISAPFQLQVKKAGGKSKGPWRNLIDVGYGISQALPVVTELLRPNAPNMFLMQQPEVHLHPSAQAAIGSLFCELAGAGRQLVVETHSDHLLERVRLDIRDGKSKLKPEDVSILYFERKDIEVNIHSLGLDRNGNVLNAPPSYGKFFMEETKRSLKL